MKKRMDRRQFLKSTSAVGGLAVAGAVAAQDETPSTPPIASPAHLSIAEKLIEANYTDAERAQIYDNLEAMVDRIKARRAGAPLENSDIPALIFDPLLPSREYKAQDNSVTVDTSKAGPLPADEDIAFAPIWKQGAWLRSGFISSNRLTDIYIQRIKKHNDKLDCYVTVMAEQAQQEAFQADVDLKNGKDKGPLHGIPYGLKDLADTKGVRTSWGAMPYKDRVPSEDAEIVKRLREAGAVLLGKTALGALAYNDLWFAGHTRNPWDVEEGSSGSSAGSASATAAGLCGFSIGSETLGSIVSPSARCGTVGLRPTFGRAPRTGAMALCWSLDKLGPICRSAEDTALVLSVLNGGDKKDPCAIDWGFSYDTQQSAAEDIKIGYDPAWFSEATTTDLVVLDALKEMGFNLTEISLPDLPYNTLFTAVEVEAAAAFEELTLTNKDDLLRWQEPEAWPNTFRAAHFISAVEALQVDRFRRQVMEAMATLYEEVDVIISPNFTDMLTVTNYTGTPSLTLPVGMESRQTLPRIGVEKVDINRKSFPHPHAITLWGNMFREDQLVAIGRLLEEKLRFAENRPSL